MTTSPQPHVASSVKFSSEDRGLPGVAEHISVAQSASPDLPPTENKKYYPALDGLRAVAVLMVFFHHYRIPGYPVLEWGWAGVDIFFVLSGFLITGILYDTIDSAHRYKNFYWRRVLRIFPLYYGVWLVSACLTPVLQPLWSRRWALWLLYLGNYTHILTRSRLPQQSVDWLQLGSTKAVEWLGPLLSFGHLWSLSVEEQFYFVWPFVVFTVRDRSRLLKICLLVIAIVPLIRLTTQLVAPRALLASELIYRGTPFRFDALLFGGAIALALRRKERSWLTKYYRAMAVASFVALVATHFVETSLLHQPHGGSPLIPWISVVGLTYVDILSACLLLFTLEPHSLFDRYLRLAPLRWLGQRSYGFYVFHDIFHPAYLNWAARLAPNFSVTHQMELGNVIALVSTLLLAGLSFRYFESPFLRLKAYFTR